MLTRDKKDKGGHQLGEYTIFGIFMERCLEILQAWGKKMMRCKYDAKGVLTTPAPIVGYKLMFVGIVGEMKSSGYIGHFTQPAHSVNKIRESLLRP